MGIRRTSIQISRISFLLSGFLLLQLILQPFAAFIHAATPIEGFSLTKEASKSVVEVGETFTYRIAYQVDSSVLTGKNITITDQVPDELDIVSPPPGWNRNGQKLTLPETFLASGTSGYYEFQVKVKPTGTASTVQVTNQAVAREIPDSGRETTASVQVAINPDPNPGTPTPTPTTPTQATYDQWETFKIQNTGLGSSIPIVGGSVIYTVGIKGTAGLKNPGSLQDITLVDTLPDPPAGTIIEFVNSSPPMGSTRSINGNVITWTIPVLHSGQSFEDKIKVTFPEYYGYAFTTSDPGTQTNTVTLATYGAITGSGSITGGTSSVTVKFGPPVAAKPGLTKSSQYAYRYHGQVQKFTIGGIVNSVPNVNSALTDLVLTDVLPPEMDYTSISLPLSWKTFEYKTNADPAWKPYTGGIVGHPRTLSVGSTADKDIVLPAGAYLTEVKWTFDKLTAGRHLEDIAIEGTVRAKANGSQAPVVHGASVTNRATLDYKVLDAAASPGTWKQADRITAAASFKINNPKPWLTAAKSFDTSMTYGPLNTVPFTLTIGNGLNATGDYLNPVIYDVLPEHFEYYKDPRIGDPAATLEQSYKLENAPAGLPKPKMDILPDKLNGRTVVRWFWDTPVSIQPGQSFNLVYKGQIQAGTPASDTGYRNDVYITTASPDTPFWYMGDPDWPTLQDVPDSFAEWQTRHQALLRPGLPSAPHHAYMVHASVAVPVVKLALVQSTKWNRGDLEPVFVASDNPAYIGEPAISVRPFTFQGNPNYTEYPYYSVTFEGGTADYKLAIRNSGNTRLGRIDVLDILPHIGDQAIRVSGTAYSPRGSLWQPNLVEVLPSGPKTFTSSAETGSRTVQYKLKAYYSKSADQDQVVNFTNARGTKYGWKPQSSYLSSDLTDIKSLYFELGDIVGSDGQPGLKAGDYIVLDWKMDAPVGAPAGKIAWNSFAIQAQEVNGGVWMLPTAPNKVGFIIDPDSVHEPLGEIGDFVWFDGNRDGLQNEAYPGDGGQRAGINGITVNLYREGDTEPYRSAKTGYDHKGNPGYYLFQGLPQGSYYVEFLLPGAYSPTAANASGPDPNHSVDNDSNLVVKGAEAGGFKSYKTGKIVLPHGVKNRTIDLGLVETGTSSGHPSARFEKSVDHVEQGTALPAPSQEYALEGNRIRFSMVFTNTSTVTLHNIRIEDVLDRGQAGYSFTKLHYDGEEIPLAGTGVSRPDILTEISNSGTKPFIVLKGLEPGKTLKLEGQYTLIGSDVDRTDLVNKGTVYYNESPVPLTDDAAIPTAGIGITKTSGTVSVSDAGTRVDYQVRVTNPGSRDLHNVVITDTKVTGIPAIPLLKAGESKAFTYTYVTVASDLNGSQLVNTVSAKPDETPQASASHSIPVLQTGGVQGSIGDYVWLDRNANGIQETGEPGVDGVTVSVYSSRSGPPLSQTITRSQDGSAGYYSFQGLAEGTYYVHFAVPSGYKATKAEAAAEDRDSNLTDAQGFTKAIVIGSAARWHDPTVDLGLIYSPGGGGGDPDDDPDDGGGSGGGNPGTNPPGPGNPPVPGTPVTPGNPADPAGPGTPGAPHPETPAAPQPPKETDASLEENPDAGEAGSGNEERPHDGKDGNETASVPPIQTDRLPTTGEASPVRWYMTGMGLVLLGMLLRRKRVKP